MEAYNGGYIEFEISDKSFNFIKRMKFHKLERNFVKQLKIIIIISNYGN